MESADGLRVSTFHNEAPNAEWEKSQLVETLEITRPT